MNFEISTIKKTAQSGEIQIVKLPHSNQDMKVIGIESGQYYITACIPKYMSPQHDKICSKPLDL